MTYQFAEELKDAGFEKKNGAPIFIEDDVFPPNLSELIEACGEGFDSLGKKNVQGWWATHRNKNSLTHFSGSTPEEAVARLWLALNKK